MAGVKFIRLVVLFCIAILLAAGVGFRHAIPAVAAEPEIEAAQTGRKNDEYICLLPSIFHNFDAYLLAFDDFSDPDSGWYEAEGDTLGYAYRDGGYELTVKKPAEAAQSGKHFGGAPSTGYSAAVDARLVSGTEVAYGFILDELQDGGFYLFQVYSGGKFVLLKWDGSVWDVLVDWTESPLIDPSGNRLRFNRKGDALSIYIDDQLLHTAKIGASSSPILISLTAQTYPESNVPAVVRYDNFELRQLAQ